MPQALARRDAPSPKLSFGFTEGNELALGRIAIFGQLTGLCRNLQSGNGMLQVRIAPQTIACSSPSGLPDRCLQGMWAANHSSATLPHTGRDAFGQQLGLSTPSPPLALSIVAILGASLSAATLVTFLRYLSGTMKLEELQSFTRLLRLPGSQYWLPDNNLDVGGDSEPTVRSNDTLLTKRNLPHSSVLFLLTTTHLNGGHGGGYGCRFRLSYLNCRRILAVLQVQRAEGNEAKRLAGLIYLPDEEVERVLATTKQTELAKLEAIGARAGTHPVATQPGGNTRVAA